jgi:hypothetical protein
MNLFISCKHIFGLDNLYIGELGSLVEGRLGATYLQYYRYRYSHKLSAYREQHTVFPKGIMKLRYSTGDSYFQIITTYKDGPLNVLFDLFSFLKNKFGIWN